MEGREGERETFIDVRDINWFPSPCAPKQGRDQNYNPLLLSLVS